AWPATGFGRAPHCRGAGPASPAVVKERRAAARYAARNKRSAQDAWAAPLEDEEAAVLHASVADFLAYGPGKSKFPALVEGFRPEENVESKTVDQALAAAGLMLDTINRSWRSWVVNPR